MLGCSQFEQLLARSTQKCEICGAPGIAGPGRNKLHIDHDHTYPRWAVRGLLCHSCNSALSESAVKAGAPWAADYLANSWWVKECERLGVPMEMASEPDHGALIVDQFDVPWLREGDGLWRPRGRGRPGISSATWKWLYRMRGPQNMALIDPWTASGNVAHLAWDAEWAALQALMIDADSEGSAVRTRRDLDVLIRKATGKEGPWWRSSQ